jgi:hypothetical protein
MGGIMWNEPSKDQLDKIPRLYETEDTPLLDKLIYLHFFIFGSDWFIAEYDGNGTFFGFVILNNDYLNAEWGLISFLELRELNIREFEIDCETGWKPVPAGGIYKIKECSKFQTVNNENEIVNIV